MSSVSASEYRRAVSVLIRDIMRFPRMFFRSVDQLETLFIGYHVAFCYLGLSPEEESFNVSFARWLQKRERIPLGGGAWVYEIQQIADVQGIDAQTVLFGFFVEFLPIWDPPTIQP